MAGNALGASRVRIHFDNYLFHFFLSTGGALERCFNLWWKALVGRGPAPTKTGNFSQFLCITDRKSKYIRWIICSHLQPHPGVMPPLWKAEVTMYSQQARCIWSTYEKCLVLSLSNALSCCEYVEDSLISCIRQSGNWCCVYSYFTNWSVMHIVKC